MDGRSIGKPGQRQFLWTGRRNAGWDAVEIEVDRNIAATLAEFKPTACLMPCMAKLVKMAIFKAC